ncbi:hypothetical protein HJFPF1_02658 [Paramyrothecium foliicola]|nr:hypothetical protein HJFPF1_02658 [Paramyrothecium foliicola]
MYRTPSAMTIPWEVLLRCKSGPFHWLDGGVAIDAIDGDMHGLAETSFAIRFGGRKLWISSVAAKRTS